MWGKPLEIHNRHFCLQGVVENASLTQRGASDTAELVPAESMTPASLTQWCQ